MVTRLGFQCCHLFIPLFGLRTSRYRRDDAFTPAPGGWVFHPYGYLVIMVLTVYTLLTKPVTLTVLGY